MKIEDIQFNITSFYEIKIMLVIILIYIVIKLSKLCPKNRLNSPYLAVWKVSLIMVSYERNSNSLVHEDY